MAQNTGVQGPGWCPGLRCQEAFYEFVEMGGNPAQSEAPDFTSKAKKLLVRTLTTNYRL